MSPQAKLLDSDPEIADWELELPVDTSNLQVISPTIKPPAKLTGRRPRGSSDTSSDPAPRAAALTDPYRNTLPHRIRQISLFLVSKFRGGGLGFFAPALRSLQMIKCQLTEIQGIEACVNLHTLWLADNRIESISGLDTLVRLRRLYLNGNRLTDLAGLDQLTDLQVLHVQQNRVESLSSLRLAGLRCLNIAENRLRCLDPDQLEALSGLQEINISGNPLVSFSEIPKLRALPRLRSLLLNDPLYAVCPIALLCNYSVYVLYHLRSLELLDGDLIDAEARQLAEATYLKKRMYYMMRAKLLDRTLIAAGRQLQSWTARHVANAPTRDAAVATVGQTASFTLNSMRGAVGAAIGAYLVELDTGGNIRLERGTSAPWVETCSDLVTSRVSPGESAALGLESVRAGAVYRLHNRFLRLGFEGAVSSRAGGGGPNLEYLFFGHFTDFPDMVQHCEQGLPAPETFEKLGYNKAVVLTNSTLACDLRQLSVPELDRTRPIRTHILVCKAYLGDVAPVVPPASAVPLTDPIGWEVATGPLAPEEYDMAPAVYYTKPTDPKQRAYSFFAPDLVLPEYLVEVEYRFAECRPPADTMPLDAATAQLGANGDLSPVAAHLLDAAGRLDLHLPPARPPAEPDLPGDFSGLTAINLSGLNLTTLAGLPELCPAVTHLNVSGNRLTTPGVHLGCLTATLVQLDLAGNCLTSLALPGVDCMPQLTRLEVEANLLSGLRDVVPLSVIAPALTELGIRGNPIASDGLAAALAVLLPGLSTVDGVAPSRPAPIGMGAVSQGAYTYKRNTRQLLTPGARAGRASALFPVLAAPPPSLAAAPANLSAQLRAVVDLDLTGQGLVTLEGIERLPCLKRLVVSRNSLATLSGLEHMVSLEEVIAKNNALVALRREWFAPLTRLRRVDLEQNGLASLTALNGLPKLTYLAVSFNRLTSATLPDVPALMEVYLAFNAIADLSPICTLQRHRSLIIVDLLGNPVCEAPEYRLFTVFYGKRIKVLDGINVDAAEARRARTVFEGRVTPEFLEGRAGHNRFGTVLDLDLSKAGIREPVGLAPLVNLVTLSLARNSIASLDDLDGLPHLERLDLSHNRLDSLGSGLARLPSLRALDVSHNRLTSMGAPYEALPRLTRLDLSHNAIPAIDGTALARLEGLDYLSLDHNTIRTLDIPALARAAVLSTITIEHNGLRGMSGLDSAADMPCLRCIFLAHNRLGEPNDLLRLHALGAASEISIAGNPVARRSVARPALVSCMPSLAVIDGEAVTPDDRARARQLLAAQKAGTGPREKEVRVVRMTALSFDNRLGLVNNGAPDQPLAPAQPRPTYLTSTGRGEFAVGPTLGTDGAPDSGRRAARVRAVRQIQRIPLGAGVKGPGQ